MEISIDVFLTTINSFSKIKHRSTKRKLRQFNLHNSRKHIAQIPSFFKRHIHMSNGSFCLPFEQSFPLITDDNRSIQIDHLIIQTKSQMRIITMRNIYYIILIFSNNCSKSSSTPGLNHMFQSSQGARGAI